MSHGAERGTEKRRGCCPAWDTRAQGSSGLEDLREQQAWVGDRWASPGSPHVATWTQVFLEGFWGVLFVFVGDEDKNESQFGMQQVLLPCLQGNII